MKVLIVGGTEFVSAAMAKCLIKKGYVVDILTRGKREINYDGVRKHYKLDRKDMESLRVSNINDEEYDYIFDICAYTKEDVEKLLNVVNRKNLKRYILCSSGAVYKPSKEFIYEEFEKGENPNWGIYGLDKKEAEEYLFTLHKEENFPITIFRPTYIYGEENNLYREIYFFNRINNKLDIPIPKSNNKNQFIYIDDLVKVFESSVHTEKAVGEAYNVTHEQALTWRELLNQSIEVLGKQVGIKDIDVEEVGLVARQFFPFRDVTYLLSIDKLKSHGLYVPKIDIKEGLAKAYKWYSKEKPQVNDIRMNKMDWVIERA